MELGLGQVPTAESSTPGQEGIRGEDGGGRDGPHAFGAASRPANGDADGLGALTPDGLIIGRQAQDYEAHLRGSMVYGGREQPSRGGSRS